MRNNMRRRASVGLATAVLTGSLASLVLAPAASAADPVLAAGSDWEVASAPGGYRVTVQLDAPLPVRADAPTVVVDGEPLGLATESPDGLSLSAFTTDPAVTRADEVAAGWASQSAPQDSAPTRAVEVPDVAAAALAAATDVDPAAHGEATWTESIYKFGDEAIALSNIGGVRGEVEGKLYLPTGGGAAPSSCCCTAGTPFCYGTGPTHTRRWPCATAPDDELRMSIPSYAGYDGTARALASHGYAVVSVSANAINSHDNQLAADRGAVARGQLLLDTLEMLRKADAGEKVAFHDAWTDRTLTLDDALVEGARSYELRREGFLNGAPDLDPVTAADLVGRFDLSTIGMMGHSRGGEGVTAAAALNQGLEEPWAIESILPLAPVDFGRMTVPNVPMNVVLPYCDGDVSNQQGQHMLDDSRYAFGDDVLRSGTWVMGANHNFFNTAWTPGEYRYSVSDDWSNNAARRTEPICGTDPSVAETSIRLTPAEQYELGTAYMTAWFRLTLGGEQRFLPMFDGTGAMPAALDGADVRTVATAPASQRATIATLEKASSLVRTVGTASAAPCASMSGRTTVQALAPCTTTMASAQLPHWTPANFGGNVPATPVTRLSWTGATDGLRVTVPAGRRDARRFDRLSVKLAADETVEVGTDLVLSVVDRAGATWSSPVSELNPYALVRMPTSASTAAASTLKKIVLQQVNVPTADLAAAGLDLADLREVGLDAVPGATAGAAYLSDLAFESSSVGSATPAREPVLGVFAPGADEGDGPGTLDLAVFLDRPAAAPVTGYVSLIAGSTPGRAAAAMEKVAFAPGETCQVVTAALAGDTEASATNGTTLTASVINTSGAVMGHDSIGFVTVREDDGVLDDATELPAYGVPGEACAELDAVRGGGAVDVDQVVAPGGTAEVAAAGFRAGEAVTLSATGLEPVTVVADGAGTAVASLAVPGTLPRGALAIRATGAATGRTATGSTLALDPSSTTLSLEPEVPSLRAPVTLRATVSGGEGVVEFLDGATVLGRAETVGGVATLRVPGFGAGERTLSARLLRGELVDGSVSAPVSVALAKNRPALRLQLGAARQVFGTAGSVVVTVGERSGEVEIGYGVASVRVPVDASGRAVHRMPATLAAGRYPVTARYLGSADAEASAVVRTTYRVTRKATRTVLRAPAGARRGGRIPVTVTVRGAVPGAPAAGRVRITVTGTTTVARTAKVGTHGKVRLTLPAPRRGGRVAVTARYLGAGSYAGSQARTVTVRLR